MKSHSILASGLRFPEGPAFQSDGTLWCVEQEGEGLFCLRPDGSQERVHTGRGSRPNGLCIDSLNRLWFCDSGRNAICCINAAGQEPEVIVDRVNGEPLSMPNDLIFDSAGNLIFTCPGPPEQGGEGLGYVCVCTPVGEVHKIAQRLSYPNGLALLPDRNTLLIAETVRKRIWYGYWNANASDLAWEHPDVWAETGDEGHGPDGMKVGPDCETVYTAVYGSSKIKLYTLQGRHLRDIRLPGENPTNCAFDPTGRLGMVVTESQTGQIISFRMNSQGECEDF